MSKLERTGELPSQPMPYSIEQVPFWRGGGFNFSPLIGIIIILILIISVFILGIYFSREYNKVLQEQRKSYEQMMGK